MSGTASLLVSAASTVAVTASAVFFARQARAARHSAEVTSLQTAAEMTQSLYRVFVDHPRMWAVFFEGLPVDQLSSEDRRRVAPTAEAYLATWEFLIAVPGRTAAERRSAWRHYAVENFAASPLLCEHLRRRAADYPSELSELAREGERRRAVVPCTRSDDSGAEPGQPGQETIRRIGPVCNAVLPALKPDSDLHQASYGWPGVGTRPIYDQQTTPDGRR